MNRRNYHIGPGAASLMLIVVALSMSALGMLALMSARNDEQLSERGVEVVEQVYTLTTAAERSLASLDAVLAQCALEAEDDAAWLSLIDQRLPVGMTRRDREISWTVQTTEERSILCAVELAEHGEVPRTHWVRHQLFTQLDPLEQEDGAWGN